MNEELPVLFRVNGYPATFASRGEKPWKESLARQIPVRGFQGEEKGLIAKFFLETLTPKLQPLDVDNLMDPLLSVLINKKEWFGGNRRNLQWWIASKSQSPTIGCELEINGNTEAPSIFAHEVEFVLNATYDGNLPADARNEFVADWASKLGSMLGRGRGYYDALLKFGDSSINIGEISTGPVKHFIDCLWPILGGSMGKPQDWRIMTLQVSKQDSFSSSSSVLVKVSPTQQDKP